jgi:uncharacterized membrane protein
MKNYKVDFRLMLSFLFLVSSQFLFSQNIENYEGTSIIMNVLKGGSNDASTLTVVTNPSKTGINTSNKVCRFKRDKDGVPWGGFWSTKSVDVTTNKYVHVKVYKTRITPIKFKLEGGPSAPLEIASTNAQTKINQWEDVVFNFSSLTGNYTTISLMPDYISPVGLGSDIIMYFDDITINSDPNPSTFITELFQNSYKVFKDIRQSNGVYLDALALGGATAKPAAIAANGIGLMALCISGAMHAKTADAVNWDSAAANQVIATTQTFINFKNNGKTNGAGMFHRYFKWDTGDLDGGWSGEYSTVDNAIFAMGLIMCKNYFSSNATIVANVNTLLGAMDYTKAIYPTQIAMVLDQSGDTGSAFTIPFNEYMLVAWLAKNANSSNPGYAKSQTFWDTYFANPTTAPVTHPDYWGYVTLSDGGFTSSFVPQFSYYFVNYFKSNTSYMNYYNNWLLSDKLYAIHTGATTSYEWGCGAGEIPGDGYSADKVTENPNKIVSPHIIAGFSSIYSNTKSDLLSLYNNDTGAAVYPLPSNTAKKVLWRYMRENTAPRTKYIQAVDYSTMLFGLASLPEFLGVNWFSSFNSVLAGSGLKKVSLGKENVDAPNKFNVYPNPFDDKITVSVEKINDAKIYLHDMAGKQLFTANMNNLTETFYLPNNLNSGLYILELITNNVSTKVKVLKK